MGSLITTTTFAALKANNTSGYSTYVWNNTDSPGLIPSNYTIAANFDTGSLWDKSQNLSPLNTSHESLTTLLGAAIQMAPMVCWIPWWGKNAYDHINIGYNQFTSNAEAALQVADMAARGLGATIDYYGVNYNPAQTYFRDACIAAGVPMTILLDSNMSPAFGNSTSAMNAVMDTINTQYFSQTNYVKVGGRPVILDFGFENFGGVTWSAVRTHISALSGGNPIWLGRFSGPAVTDRGGFLDGWYGWPSPSDGVANYLKYFYTRMSQQPTKKYLGPIFKGFNDTLASWGTNRLIAQNNGQSYVDTINGVKSHGPMLGALVATWNDYEEGTEIETGVGAGSNLGVVPSVSGNLLSWTVTGNTNCIAKYRVWASLDGTNTGTLADVVGATSYDLSTSGIDVSGNYQVYVQIIGLSSVVNVLSTSYANWIITTPPTPAPSGNFTAAPTSINAGQSALLTWSTLNTSSVTLNLGAVALSGSLSVTPSATTTYTLSATGTGGTLNLTATVVVIPPTPVPTPSPTPTPGVQSRPFPAPLLPSSVGFSLASVLLGQTLTVTLNPLYSAADQWQVMWPDGANTGWLPLSANVVAKSFHTPGAQAVVIQTRKDYSGSQFAPPASLLRQTSKQIFVVDQQVAGTNAQTSGLTGDLGIGGQQGFEITEITDASNAAVRPNVWEVIARALVRDAVSNELKLLVATSRFSNASSLLGTMAMDVFPVEGRPHSTELIEPVYELTVTDNTSDVSVRIATNTLPSLIVGKSVAQGTGGTVALQTKPNTGIEPFLWSVSGLPDGVVMSSSGVVNGTPLKLGTFAVTFAVQDSAIPFSIDEITLELDVVTDLLVQIAASQRDAQNTLLVQTGTSLGAAQVGTVYKVQMEVGNTNPSATASGGLPPYTWSIPAGTLPIGLRIDPATGVISGTPCTYNSTTDFTKTYTAIVQVTDAIGAKATQTYSMTLIPAALQLGQVDQPNIYSAQQFKLLVPVFGGKSPYTFTASGPDWQVSPSDSSYYTTPALIDGQIEVDVDFPTSAAGTHTFTVTAHDALSASNQQSITFTVNNEISDIRLVPGFVDHVWAYSDTAAVTPIAVSGDLTGYTVAGATVVTDNGVTMVVNPSFQATAPVINLSFQVTSSVLAVHTATPHGLQVGQPVTITGSLINAVPPFTYDTASGDTFGPVLSVPDSTHYTVGCTHGNSALLNSSSPAGTLMGTSQPSNVSSQAEFTGPVTLFRNAQVRVPLGLMQSGTTVATVSREYTLDAHNDQAIPGEIGTITSYARPFIVGDLVGFNARKPYFNSPNIDAFNKTPNTTWTTRVQNGSTLPPGLSFDVNTGLTYGTLVGIATDISVIEYVDSGGTVHGTATINWATYQSDFQLLDNFSNVDGHQIGVDLAAASVIAAPSGVLLSAPTVIAGVLPAGVSLALDNGKANVTLNGTPTEAGYFDIWLRVTGNGSQTAYIYHRLAIDYTKPLAILNTSPLPSISAQSYTLQLQGYGGIPPYTWSSPQFPGGAGTGVIAGLTLVTNSDNTATISGTLSSVPVTSPTDLFTSGSPLTIVLADNSFPTPLTKAKPFTWQYDNRLRITTPIVPVIVPGSDYGFSMGAAGGKPPYTFKIASSPTLPTGIAFDAVAPSYGTGVFSGITNTSGYDQFIGITVQDSLAATSSGYNLSGAPYEIKTGVANLLIDYSGVGGINRGVPYQGTLVVTGTFTAPISWQVAPTAIHPKTMLSGLTLQPQSDPNAVIAGTYSGIPHQTENIVRITGNGGNGTVTVYTQQSHGFLVSDSVVLTNTTNFNGTVTVASVATASFTYSATNANPDETSGLVTDNPNLYSVRIVAVDAGGQIAVALVPLNTSTDLTITTAGLPNATVGGTYSTQMAASGGVAPYTWTLDAISVDTLTATGLSMNSAGLISGTASGIFVKNLTFRVTDALGGTPNIARGTLTLSSQASGLAITTTLITPATSGRAYTFQMQAAGSPNLPYVWSLSPTTQNQLPTGLTMDSLGKISGNTTLTGFSRPVTFRVTDTIAAFTEKTLTVAVVAGLALQSGIDFTDNTNTGIIGYVSKGQVDSISPRPNRSFYVVAAGVVSTSPNQVSVSVGNSNISAVVESISGGNAFIRLSGVAFAAAAVGNNVVSISVTDSGVNVSGSFTWVVYDDGILRIGATLPTQLTTP